MRLFFIFLFCFSVLQLFSDDFKSPEEFNTDKRKVNNEEFEDSFISAPFRLMIRFYQIFVSPVNQENCQMHPSCSEYTLGSIRLYGIFGILMAVDRLNRCGHELREYEVIIVNGKIKNFDPVK